MRFIKLSTLALAMSLSFGTVLPAQANTFNLLLRKKQHHIHQQHHRSHHPHRGHHRVNPHRRVYHRNRGHHRVNHHRHHSPRRRVFNQPRSYGGWHGRH